MLIFPVAPFSRAHAANTAVSFTATQTISSMPFALMASAFCTKLGRWTWEQVRVNAPGTAKRTMRLPAKRSAADTARRPLIVELEQPHIGNGITCLEAHCLYLLTRAVR